jgi:hypothetical protein
MFCYLLCVSMAIGGGALPLATKLAAEFFGKEEVGEIRGAGIFRLQGTKAAGVDVTGSLIAQEARLGGLLVKGEANLQDCRIEGTAEVIGSLRAYGGSFEKELALLAQKAVFEQCDVAAIRIREDLGFKGKQVIELKKGTHVRGSIVFEAGRGEVILHPGAHLLGNVTGGHIVKKGR